LSKRDPLIDQYQTMWSFDDGDDGGAHPYEVLGAAEMMQFTRQNIQVSTKVPPAFDGRTSWFAYEDLIDEWEDVTNLDQEKRGPALRNRLDGDAATYKNILDRELLKDPAKGVAYFKKTLRPHFVKGSQNVFLWRFFQFVRANRGSQELLRWLVRMQVLRKRLTEAWMDLLVPATQAEYVPWITELNRVRVAMTPALDALDPDDPDTLALMNKNSQ